MGTPDHNNWLPPAFASYQPHHDPGGSTGQQFVTKTTHEGGPGTSRAKPVEPSKPRNPTFRNPHIINQALLFPSDEPDIMPVMGGLVRSG